MVDDLSSAWTVPDGMNLDLLNTGGAGEQTHVEDPRKDELAPPRSLLCLPFNALALGRSQVHLCRQVGLRNTEHEGDHIG